MALVPITLPPATEVEFPRVASTAGEFSRWLGTFQTSGGIADWLERHGIRGEQSCGSACPLARLAQNNLDDDYATVGSGAVYSDGESAQLPYVGVEFVIRFDAGHFPQIAV